mmetsp:Transcript_17333/g.19761  ORF Transcript_17333/g.19761 Transcript_17333/m.19761 type:complete len:118 (+) Transcript_17333:10-363(+)
MITTSKNMFKLFASATANVSRMSSSLSTFQVNVSAPYELNEPNPTHKYLNNIENQKVTQTIAEPSPVKLQYIELLSEVSPLQTTEEIIHQCLYKKARRARMKRIRRKKGNNASARTK